MDEDFTAQDALRVLAMPLWRWNNRQFYALKDGRGWKPGVRTQVYANGTDAGFAGEEAEYILECGPMLQRVLEAGVRALADDKLFQSYLTWLYSGDHRQIVAAERKARKQL